MIILINTTVGCDLSVEPKFGTLLPDYTSALELAIVTNKVVLQSSWNTLCNGIQYNYTPYPNNSRNIWFPKYSKLFVVTLYWFLYRGNQADRSGLYGHLVQSQSELTPKSMKESYQEVLIPLRSRPELQEMYVNWFKTIRIGKVLEDLDTFAGRYIEVLNEMWGGEINHQLPISNPGIKPYTYFEN